LWAGTRLRRKRSATRALVLLQGPSPVTLWAQYSANHFPPLLRVQRCYGRHGALDPTFYELGRRHHPGAGSLTREGYPSSRGIQPATVRSDVSGTSSLLRPTPSFTRVDGQPLYPQLRFEHGNDCSPRARAAHGQTSNLSSFAFPLVPATLAWLVRDSGGLRPVLDRRPLHHACRKCRPLCGLGGESNLCLS
jgi:hypothetical protein